MRKAFLLLALLALPPAAYAKAPPSQLDALYDQLRSAQDAHEAQALESKIELLQRQSGSPSVDLLMTRAKTALGQADNKAARRLLDAVTALAPHYAEGWHLRAQLQQADGDDTGALMSLQKAVQANPRAFAALSDLADMLADYGDKPGALKLYRRVQKLDPQMPGIARQVRALSRDVEGQGI
jgi:tetratricopeptide (TPR) repeat protein